MTLDRSQFAINTLQWTDLAKGWEYDDPAFLGKQPRVLAEAAESGFAAVMMEVLPTQTIRAYRELLAENGLRAAPGYLQVPLPESHGVTLEPGSAAEFRWFDGVRRRADETHALGLDTLFLSAEMVTGGGMPRFDEAAGVGHAFDRARLERYTDLLGRAAEILTAEGIRPAFHNHVGSWVETREEIEHVLAAIPESVLGAGFDLGHLFWAGADVRGMLREHRDRIAALHLKDLDVDRVRRLRAEPGPYTRSTDDLFLEPGLGGVPLLEYLGELPDAFGGWIVVEVDRPSMEPLASARASWKWVESNFPAV
ncbi:TIM barrel protein [Amycolatopsis rubida]|uniref:TIM barrel protein n=1 Tax=Amycolatopsis rubida TaxID=112413 RepID=A0ABX0C3M4_9PSEU|nr:MULTISPECIES: sugar phosphate isomerase/epimerase [Amycolatopsis]MYW96413.1 TIM barrel protein [Amycolatopsis rubida]NEC61400.1 TIM barrel protein [Amycolatopsis rubida]OAP28129.1 Inosose dehydratase [Amycolatopsis sp. M39]